MSFLDIFAYTVVIGRETVKSPKNTIFDTWAQNWWRYEFSDIFAHTVVISRKTVKSGKNTFCDLCAQNLRSLEFSDIFAHTVVIRSKNVGKLISPPVLCPSVKNRVLILCTDIEKL